MVEGHVEFTLSLCVCLLVFVFQNCVPPIALSCIVGFDNYLAQMIVITR